MNSATQIIASIFWLFIIAIAEGSTMNNIDSENIAAINESDSEYWLNLGDSYLNISKYNESIDAYDQSLSLNRSFIPAWIHKGVSLFSIGKYNESLKCFDMAIKIDPDSAKAWANRGMVFGALGQYNASLESLDNALKLDDSLTAAWCNKGTVLCNVGKYNESLDAYQQALRLDPENHYAMDGKNITLDALNLQNSNAKDPRKVYLMRNLPPMDINKSTISQLDIHPMGKNTTILFHINKINNITIDYDAANEFNSKND